MQAVTPVQVSHPCHRRTASQWQSLCDAYEGSRLTRKQFCQKHSLARSTLANREELKRLKAQRREEYLQRIPIEGKFGQGKNGYRLNYIRAKQADTSSAWINSIFLVMNLLILLKVFFAPWIKAVRQPLSRIWTSVWALRSYRFPGLCLRMPGVARD